MNPVSGNSRRKLPILLFSGIFILIILLALGSIALALTPYAIREIWLPMAAKSAGATIQAEEIYLDSIFPFRLRTRNLRYSDPETTVEIRSAVSRLRTSKLKKHIVELAETRINGIRVVCHPPRPRQERKTDAGRERSQTEEESSPWNFAMKEFHVENAIVEIENHERKTVQIWTASSLNGNQFLAGETCSLSAEAAVKIRPDKRNPMVIRNLPFRLRAEYLLDPEFRLKDFKMVLKTGICDLSITEEIVIPARAGISAGLKMTGCFPNPDTLRIIDSEIHLFKGREDIGKLQFKGMFGNTFQCEGVFTDLDMQPYLSILVPGSRVDLDVPHAEFIVTGRDFSPEGIRRDLKARLIARLEKLSIPVELNRESRIMRMIMIPVEAMPTLLELLEMKWNLNHEFQHCLNSVNAVISGTQNLNFDRASMDIALENGILKIADITLLGKEIEMESIKGTLDLGSEKIDLRTILVVSGVKLPLNFKGTLNDPAAHFKDALKDFVLLNAPLLKKLEALLTEPPSEKDSKLEKAIKRGYRDLNRFLK
ncbi:MAG: hypothetical protein J5858_01670 [Lentisphaeria bacterium]|nr:hypothetical protein [Lentisphaeria bacterium]